TTASIFKLIRQQNSLATYPQVACAPAKESIRNSPPDDQFWMTKISSVTFLSKEWLDSIQDNLNASGLHALQLAPAFRDLLHSEEREVSPDSLSSDTT